jgi:flagella basal body P-ring formation protein FlgA
VRSELENLRTDLNAAAGEKDLLSEEREELRKQLEEAQVTAVANEDRAVKAYQKIKNDEKLREKTRKALEIALQLLQENADAEEADESAKRSA